MHEVPGELDGAFVVLLCTPGEVQDETDVQLGAACCNDANGSGIITKEETCS